LLNSTNAMIEVTLFQPWILRHVFPKQKQRDALQAQKIMSRAF